MEFTSKVVREQLRDEYECYAHFYNIIDIPCRRQLEVIRKSTLPFNNSIVTNIPDATLIMANPGTAKPFDAKKIDVLNQPLNSSYPFHKSEFTKVDDEMDQTLWRVKELMRLKDWFHVRVINLSDLRAGNEKKYAVLKKKFHMHKGFENFHSLFSKQRVNELSAILAYNKTAPVILAWGLKNQAQREFAFVCLDRLKKLPITKIGYVKDENEYYHPLAPGGVSNV